MKKSHSKKNEIVEIFENDNWKNLKNNLKE